MGRVVRSASGLSIIVGERLYDESGEAFLVMAIEEPDERLIKPAVTVYSGLDCKRYTMHPKNLFHFRPDKCADGRVLKCGQVVWPLYRRDGPFIVSAVIEGFVSCYRLSDPETIIHISPDGLVHNKPVERGE